MTILNATKVFGYHNYKLYSLCTLYVYTPLHLTIGSRVVLPQNELCILKCCHVNF
jgi:hypothetical protein